MTHHIFIKAIRLVVIIKVAILRVLLPYIPRPIRYHLLLLLHVLLTLTMTSFLILRTEELSVSLALVFRLRAEFGPVDGGAIAHIKKLLQVFAFFAVFVKVVDVGNQGLHMLSLFLFLNGTDVFFCKHFRLPDFLDLLSVASPMRVVCATILLSHLLCDLFLWINW